MKRGKRVMITILGVIILVLAVIMLWFKIPYSPLKSDFTSLASTQIAKTHHLTGNFTENDLAALPPPVQKYFRYCGYLGTPKMWNMRASFKDVDFVLSQDKPKVKIDYVQYNFVNEPVRFAFIDTSMYGLPFQGLDAFQNGKGSMKGVLGKAFTLFDQKGKDMDKASLVTCLAESLIVPNFALQDFIKWEPIDDTHAKATITYDGMSVGGVFTFDKNGAMTNFTTDDRTYIDVNGNVRKVKWSAICGSYKETNGIKHPTALKAIWHLNTGDLVYFDSHNAAIQFNVAK